jgi:hypothetical protein
MAKTAAELILIVRNVTGRVDSSDPQFTDDIMLQYIQDFIQLSATQDVRLFKNMTWWEFNLTGTDPDPLPVDLNTLPLINGHIGASTIGSDAYADGFKLYWYQSPYEFYQIWPETQVYQPTRPTYVLYYNNSLTFRNPPAVGDTYLIKIQAYQYEVQIDPDTSILNDDYLYRYICYGTALDIFSDFGETDKFNEIFPMFRRYRSFVYGRTACQYQSQRPSPEF